MGKDWSNRLHSALTLAIKLRQILTREGYVLLKIFGDSLRHSSQLTEPAQAGSSHNPNPSLIQERNVEKILGFTRKMIQLLTGEVPIRCQDVTVYFTKEEWEYVEGHKDLYKDVLVENTIVLKSIGDHNIKGLQDASLEKISGSKTLDQNEDCVVEKIFHHTKEIIHLLTKEKYILIWNRGDPTTPCGADHVSEFISTTSPPSLIHERKNDGKILDVSNKIIELLTGEASIRYEDIKVCFSMEEWEYLEGHKDLYKDVMMDTEIDESYDKSSLNFTREKPLDCCKRGKDSFVMPHNLPHQVVESTKSCHNRPNIGKHKKKQKETPVPCCKCGKPLKRSDVRQTETNTADSKESKKFCRKCLIDNRAKDTKKRFACLECGKYFSNKGYLEVHLRIHTLSKIFPCSECDKIFTTAYSLEIHMRFHTGEKPYKCSECGKYFCNAGNLLSHYRVHTGERPFPCSECNKTFRYKSHLVAHQRFHTGQTMPCSECGKRFVFNSHLVRHLQIHTGEKPFKCLECGKSFQRRSELAQHEMIHTGESPFKCEECSKCFRFASELFRHQKTHTDEKPFYCSKCSKSFTRNTSLAEHEKIHTGEKPYSCPECSKCFVTFNYMLRHLRIHNRKKS